jgi:hypothetical protein
MYTGLEQLFHRNNGHDYFLLFVFLPPQCLLNHPTATAETRGSASCEYFTALQVYHTILAIARVFLIFYQASLITAAS